MSTTVALLISGVAACSLCSSASAISYLHFSKSRLTAETLVSLTLTPDDAAIWEPTSQTYWHTTYTADMAKATTRQGFDTEPGSTVQLYNRAHDYCDSATYLSGAYGRYDSGTIIAGTHACEMEGASVDRWYGRSTITLASDFTVRGDDAYLSLLYDCWHRSSPGVDLEISLFDRTSNTWVVDTRGMAGDAWYADVLLEDAHRYSLRVFNQAEESGGDPYSYFSVGFGGVIKTPDTGSTAGLLLLACTALLGFRHLRGRK